MSRFNTLKIGLAALILAVVAGSAAWAIAYGPAANAGTATAVCACKCGCAESGTCNCAASGVACACQCGCEKSGVCNCSGKEPCCKKEASGSCCKNACGKNASR